MKVQGMMPITSKRRIVDKETDLQRDSSDEDDEAQEKRSRVDALVMTIDLYTSGP